MNAPNSAPILKNPASQWAYGVYRDSVVEMPGVEPGSV